MTPLEDAQSAMMDINREIEDIKRIKITLKNYYAKHPDHPKIGVYIESLEKQFFDLQAIKTFLRAEYDELKSGAQK